MKPNIWDLIENSHDDTFILIIKGHIYIEYLLNEILQKTLKDPPAINADKLGFYKKVTLLKALGTISKEMSGYLISFNKIRNGYAHRIKYKPNHQEAFNLAREARKAGIYFKDENIFGNEIGSENFYSIHSVFGEVIINTFQEMLSKHSDCFSHSEISEYLRATKNITTLT